MGTTVRSGILIVLLAVLAAACSGGESIPATAPSTTTTAAVTITSTTTTTVATTTTVDRVAEIEAILSDLELRRLQALYDGDEAAYAQVFANDGFLERSLALLGSYTPLYRPDEVHVEIERVLADVADCMVLRTYRDLSALYPDDDSAVGVSTVVIERVGGEWGFSYQYLEEKGWMCDAPHPLGS